MQDTLDQFAANTPDTFAVDTTEQGQDEWTTGLKERREHDPDNEPPFSRVFIVCGKSVNSDEQLKEYFVSCGRIEYCKIIRDKITNESKGIAYIKFDKTSSAAIAIETMNGKQIIDNLPPLKVMIADAKGSKQPKPVYKEPEDTPPRSRLFVICSKDLTEDELVQKFQVFGELEYCKIMRDKQTGESKGFGFVKFSKASTAAVAMENINEQNEIINGVRLKAIIADPKAKAKRTNEFYPRQDYYYPMPAMGYYQPYAYPEYNNMAPFVPFAPAYVMPRQRLFVVCHKSVTQEQLAGVFSKYPGMEYCDLKKNKATGESKGFAYVNYTTLQAAMMAKEQLDGYELPPGSYIKVMYAEPKEGKVDMGMNLYPFGFPGTGAMEPVMEEPMHPDLYLPEGSRLFIMMTKPLPEYILQDVFLQFPGLEYVTLNNDMTTGYVKYSTAMAAQSALNYLNNAEISGTRIRIQVANVPTQPTNTTTETTATNGTASTVHNPPSQMAQPEIDNSLKR